MEISSQSRFALSGCLAAAMFFGCGGFRAPSAVPGNMPQVSRSKEISGGTAPVAHGDHYQPLAIGNSWKYTCRDVTGGGENNGNPFPLYHKVIGATKVGTQRVYEFSLQVPQVPSRPLRIDTEIMLLNNDTHGNLWLYGYFVHDSVHKVHASEIVSAATPAKGAKFDYTGPNRKSISRIFCCIEETNKTPLGLFTVADYEESANTHDYGYAKGTGIAEEDHGPNYEVDCLIKAVTLH
jgi:hypothetical protein